MCNIDKTKEGEITEAINLNCNNQINETQMRCKENATSLCRSSVSDWAALLRSATNINECKDVDPSYKGIQDLSDSCAGEYSFPVVSYHVEIIQMQ